MSDLLLKGPFVRLGPKSISDEDFEADVKLTIDGDWKSQEHKEQYMQAVIKALNNATEKPATGAQVTDDVTADFLRLAKFSDGWNSYDFEQFKEFRAREILEAIRNDDEQ